MAATRSRRRDDRRRGSDLGSRIAFGVPALAFAIAIVVAGGGWFAVGVALLGIACMHELLTAYEHTGRSSPGSSASPASSSRRSSVTWTP
jgi:hypothetical protein